MAVQWSSETFVEEFKDLQANAMAVDCLGTYAVLAGKKTLAFVNLENPDEEEDGSNVTRVTRQSKWDISCVQFNPHASHAHLFVTACNQRLDINQLTDKTGHPLCSLKAHSRIISDVDWSPFDVNIVASCSIDCFTYLWDIREPKKPVHSFQTVAGAYQVKWNKVTNNLFATTHEGDIRIWDPRKGNMPQQYIAAHLSKIHGLDWSPTDQYQFVTASQDGYVRLWDYTNPKKWCGSMDSGAPVRRARYTPFGAGLVTVVVPQLKRGENSLYLWKIAQHNQMQPIHTFVGHKDAVLEFQWKKQPEGGRDQQLVTWSRDQSLRIWRIDHNLQRLCGHDTGEAGGGGGEVGDLTGTSYNSSESTLKELRDLTLGGESSTVDEELGLSLSLAAAPGAMVQQPLHVELNSLGGIHNIAMDQMDPVNRMCRATAMGSNHKVVMECLFPAAYPNNVAPAFQILHSTLDAAMQSRLMKVLNDTATKYVKRNSNCMDMCLHQMMSVLESFDDRRSPDSEVPFTRPQPSIGQATAFLPMYSLGSFQDSSVPFPRTCGARFCSNGFLVAFGVPAEMKKVSEGSEVTPKALSDLAAFGQNWKSTGPSAPFPLSFFSRSPPTPSTDAMSISNFFEPKGKRASRQASRRRRHEREGDKPSKKQQSVGKVKLYNVEALIGVSRLLAHNYIMDLNDIEKTCRHNRNAAAAIGRKDLVQIWSMMETMSSKKLHPSPFPQQEVPWAMGPFGRPLLKYTLDQYAAQFDVQTLAMLCCLFWAPDLKPRHLVQRSTSKTSLEFTPPNYNPYHTVSSVSGLLKGWRTTNFTTHPTTAPPLRVDPPTCSQAPPTHPSSSHMSEVASQPNLAALFKAGGTQNVNEMAVAKSKRSLSWSDTSDLGDDIRYSEAVENRDREEDEKQQHGDNCKMLNPGQWEQYDLHKLAYANILYNWRLFNQRALVLKFISSPMPQHKGVEFAVCCHKCSMEMRGPQCSKCKYPALQCSICHMAVRGLSNFCLVCSHGGHTAHMMEWFMTQSVCPTGCGCNCMKENFFGM